MDQSNPGIRQLVQALITPVNALITIYKQPGNQNQRSVIKHLVFCNYSDRAALVDLLVAPAGSITPTSFVLFQLPVAPSESKIYEWGNGGLAVEPGGVIVVRATVDAAIAVTISGIEYF